MGTVTKDIVDRLSWLSAPRFSSIPVADTIAEARNEIITLRNRNKRLEHQVRVLQVSLIDSAFDKSKGI